MNKIVQIIKKVKRMLYRAFKNADGLYILSEGGNLAQTFSASNVIKLSLEESDRKQVNKKNRKRR